MPLTKEEIEQHIAHYSQFRELPSEVMAKLFGIALAAVDFASTKTVDPEAKKPRVKKESTPEVQA